MAGLWARFLGSSIITKAFAGVVLALVLLLGIQTARLGLSQRQAKSNALARDSAEAAADTTRGLLLSEKKRSQLFGDSLVAVERRAIQRPLERDELDKATGRTSTTRVGVTGTIRTAGGHATGTVTTEAPATAPPLISTPGGRVDGLASIPAGSAGDSVRVAEFVDYREPYTLKATARLPRAGTGSAAGLDWSVRTDTARMSYRVQCGRPIRGIRPASVVAIGPKWLELKLGEVEQSPETCANAAAVDGRAWWKPRPQIGLGYGAVYELSPKDKAARIHHGLGGFVGVGWTF